MAQLSMSVAPANGTTNNLTALGTADWIVYPGASTVRKSGGSSIALAHVGSFSDSTSSPGGATATWSDGATTVSGSTQNVVFSSGAAGVGYQATFPADTSTRTAYMLVGVYGTALQVTATLSDGSFAAQVDNSVVWVSGSGLVALVSVTYSAASAGQSMTIKATQPNGTTGTNACMQFAALTTATAPRVTGSAISVNLGGGVVNRRGTRRIVLSKTAGT